MYYLQSRYYDPAIGRFINADTFATTDADGFLSCNMFAYCENNPVNRSDETGELFAEIVGGAVAGAIIGVASTFINAHIDGKKVTGLDVVTGALRGALSGGIAGGFSVAGTRGTVLCVDKKHSEPSLVFLVFRPVFCGTRLILQNKSRRLAAFIF